MRNIRTRPRGTKTYGVTIRFELGVYDAVCKYAKKHHISIALATDELVQKGLEEAIARKAS